jgi:PAS domain S-box-containing protein
VALLFLRTCDDPRACVERVRDEHGVITMLVGILDGREVDLGELIEAGLDDAAESLSELFARFPFVASRLRLRARRQLRLEAILENTVDGILVIDSRGVVQSVNKAVERIFQYTPEEVVGHNVSMLMPSPDRERHDQYLSRYLREGQPRIIGIGREVVGRRKDGSLFPLDLAVSEARMEGKSLFAGVVRDISERRELEAEVLRISEEERRRIGRDMHDGLGQMLTGIGLIAKNVAQRLSKEGNLAAEDIGEIASLIRDADEQARALSRGLVPVELDRNGLASALDRLCGQAERLFGGRCHLKITDSVSLEDGTVAINLYRIAQEAVSNAFKHGRAENVHVRFGLRKGHIVLIVEDDGIGFNKAPRSSGMGVQIMQYRASVLGGRLEIFPAENGGSIVSCDIPRVREEEHPPTT